MRRVTVRPARQSEKAPTGITGFDEITGGDLTIRRVNAGPR